MMRRKPARPQELDAMLARIDFDQAPLPSPCIGICHVNSKTTFCEGCWRTIDEIAEWSTLGESGKRAVWEAIVQRRAAR